MAIPPTAPSVRNTSYMPFHLTFTLLSKYPNISSLGNPTLTWQTGQHLSLLLICILNVIIVHLTNNKLHEGRYHVCFQGSISWLTSTGFSKVLWNEWMYDWMDGWMDRRMNGWMDNWKITAFRRQIPKVIKPVCCRVLSVPRKKARSWESGFWCNDTEKNRKCITQRIFTVTFAIQNVFPFAKTTFSPLGNWSFLQCVWACGKAYTTIQ